MVSVENVLDGTKILGLFKKRFRIKERILIPKEMFTIFLVDEKGTVLMN